MYFEIPILADFLRACMQPDFYDRIELTSLICGLLVAVFLTFKKIPYGKTYTRKTSLLKYEVNDRVAVIITNLPGPIIFFYSQIFYPNGELLSIPSLVYLAHYIHRALIYPWFRKVYSKPWPLESVLYFIVYNFIVGLTVSHTLIFSGKELNIYIQLLIAVVCVACAVIAAIHDYYLCSLRSAGDIGYRIPYGMLFKWVSGPNYLFELIEWCVYAIYMPFGLGLAVYGIWYLTNITGRAESNHDAYTSRKRIFPSGTKYPDDRAPYIPFVFKSKYLI
ncbi:hypothetical protein M9Y10_029154 [Tritrichomonas musculus]|uniref:3-oxo-5-alpha-steroid 4-dehydrogenase C-terminal domain-containing protein n=1 Tax=Tritrichomonas musculus TaxID=1915356 RepID=A0ABR2KND4_9EUKA